MDFNPLDQQMERQLLGGYQAVQKHNGNFNFEKISENSLSQNSSDTSKEHRKNNKTQNNSASKKVNPSTKSKRQQIFDSQEQNRTDSPPNLQNDEELAQLMRNTAVKLKITKEWQKRRRPNKKAAQQQLVENKQMQQMQEQEESSQELQSDDEFTLNSVERKRKNVHKNAEQYSSQNHSQSQSFNQYPAKRKKPLPTPKSSSKKPIPQNHPPQLFNLNAPPITKFKYNNFIIPDKKIYQGTYQQDSDAQYYQQDDSSSESQKQLSSKHTDKSSTIINQLSQFVSYGLSNAHSHQTEIKHEYASSYIQSLDGQGKENIEEDDNDEEMYENDYNYEDNYEQERNSSNNEQSLHFSSTSMNTSVFRQQVANRLKQIGYSNQTQLINQVIPSRFPAKRRGRPPKPRPIIDSIKQQPQTKLQDDATPRARGRPKGSGNNPYQLSKGRKRYPNSEIIPPNYYEVDLTKTLPIYHQNRELFERFNLYLPIEVIKQEPLPIMKGLVKKDENNTVKINFEEYQQTLKQKTNHKDRLVFEEQTQLNPRKQFERDMAVVYSSAGYGMGIARSFFGNKLIFSDYHQIIKSIVFRAWRVLQQSLFLNRVSIFSIKCTNYNLLKQFLIDWRTGNYLNDKQSITFRKCIRIGYKFSSTQASPNQAQLVTLYKKVMTVLNQKINGEEYNNRQNRTKHRKMDKQKLWTLDIERQACEDYITTSIQRKNLALIRNRLLERHPQLPSRQFDQDLVRTKFRAIFRRTPFRLMQQRKRLMQEDPSLDLPKVKRIDDNKLRAIMHGNDGSVVRVALIRCHLDINDIELVRTAINQLNSIDIPGVIYDFIKEEGLGEYQEQAPKRGRKRKIKPENAKFSESTIKEQYVERMDSMIKKQKRSNNTDKDRTIEYQDQVYYQEEQFSADQQNHQVSNQVARPTKKHNLSHKRQRIQAEDILMQIQKYENKVDNNLDNASINPQVSFRSSLVKQSDLFASDDESQNAKD